MAHYRLPSFGPWSGRVLPNRWDALAFALLFGILISFVHGGRETLAPLSAVTSQPVALDPSALPEYALRTVLRMLAAIVASLVFTLIYATAAAKSRRAEMVLIPLLDILQSVPVLGFLSFTVTAFMGLFPGRTLGAECAAVFAIFTSQAWNMTFSFYQSLKTVPRDLDEVSRAFHLSAWQRFWRLEVPFAMPGLVWNAMMSMSGGWFFVVASEAISVGDTTITLPGIGAYVATAIDSRNLAAVGYAVAAMLAIIILYDQLLFRPMVAWAEKFRFEQASSGPAPKSWLLQMAKRTRLLKLVGGPLFSLLHQAARWRLPLANRRLPVVLPAVWADRLWSLLVLAMIGYFLVDLFRYIHANLSLSETGTAILLGFYTLLRVLILTILASVVWVPIGIWVGLRPKLARTLQPLAQFLAAFPANIAFPFAVVLIIKAGLNPEIWLSPLMILGTQWYILFNVIAGASAFPGDLREAARSFKIRGVNWWRKVMIPGVFPYYVTGALTASGGSWNASIVTETVSWGQDTLTAHGLGSYIAQATAAGDYPRIILGIAVMSLYVVMFNRLIWRPLFTYAARRLRFD